MKDLLPKPEELKPITNPNDTFYECGFNDDFDHLKEQQKLQIICDIVRETIYPNPYPNPLKDVAEMNGNCHTACLVMKDYLKKLKLCKNVKHVMARKRKLDPDDIVSIHSILLVEGNDSHIYQIDPAPYVGYKMGQVIDMKDQIYEEYVEITPEMEYYINVYKEIIYLNTINKIDPAKVKDYLKICLESLQHKILGAYCGNALKILVRYIDNPKQKDKITKLIAKLRPYSKTNTVNKAKQKELVNKQVKLWREELKDLIASNTNFKRQLELCQCIIQELKMQYPEYEIMRNINGTDTRLSFMNPRYMYEHGLNVLMIKPSAYLLGVQDEIRDSYLEKYHHTGAYSANLALPTEQTGVKPLIFSHPLGEGCIRSFNGQSDIYLIKADPKSILTQKKYLREHYCKDLWNQELTWFDGEPILWDPYVTNLVHGTDTACEASLHYMIGNPEHQNMTRFMYPNPRLEYKFKK